MKTKDKKIIEDSERDGIPIFVLTAKDKISLQTIKDYFSLCNAAGCKTEFIKAILDRVDEFDEWQILNHDKVKFPD